MRSAFSQIAIIATLAGAVLFLPSLHVAQYAPPAATSGSAVARRSDGEKDADKKNGAPTEARARANVKGAVGLLEEHVWGRVLSNEQFIADVLTGVSQP